jgi:hypothetical protein
MTYCFRKLAQFHASAVLFYVFVKVMSASDCRTAPNADAWHYPLVLEVVYAPLLPDALPLLGGGSDILLAATGHP